VYFIGDRHNRLNCYYVQNKPMDINTYIRPLIRWWRLIAIVTVVAMVASTISVMLQTNYYVTKTTLVVGTSFLDPNPDSNKIYIAQQLAGIYADRVLREPIQVATMNALGINWLPQYQSRVVPNTQMVEISVTDTNPQRAQIVANELANQLILQSPTIGDTETGERQDFIKEQLSSLQNQIQATEKEIEELQKSLVGLTSASQILNIENKIREQTVKLDSLRTNYAGFLANSQEGAVNIVSVLEPANLPSRPVGTNKFTIIILAGMVGFSLGAGASYLLEFLDRTIKTASDIERIFNLPVIGYISEITNNKDDAVYVTKHPDSLIAENYRLLQSNIEFFRSNDPIKTILITSPNQGNGKTTVASSLALSFSQVDQDVILVDADLRRSAVHKSLKMAKAPGLSDVIKNKVSIESAVRESKSSKKLKVLTGGHRTPNVTEVVGSKRISAILSELKELYELIIIDAPPLIIADTYNLASTVDGVIIIMVPGQTSEDQARAIKEQLERANANILGFVFNKVSEERVSSYGDYQYRSLYASTYYGDYTSKAMKGPATLSPSRKLIDFFEHGKIPAGVAAEVENAISAIKTQPKNMLNRFKNSKKKDKS
jgi:capsular exopolysaccharide synthesis family protein